MIKAAWIDKRERLPGAEDTDPTGCVLAWQIYNGIMITGPQNVAESPYITHWLPALEGPQKEQAQNGTQSNGQMVGR